MQSPQEILQIQQESLAKVTNKLNRYFVFSKEEARGGGSSGLARMFGFGQSDGRKNLSTIIEGQIYLGPISMCQLFIRDYSKGSGGLVVSCCDVSELVGSGLLDEPESKTMKYHVLAMEDGTGRVGSSDQIHDALNRMLSNSKQKLPVLIHCYEGVGRSPMMTVLHIAHRYLLRDIDVVSLIENFNVSSRTRILLNPENDRYIENLYEVVKNYVKYRRSCSQFDRHDRYEIAINVLKSLYQQIKTDQKIDNMSDQNYQFIADLTQSVEFKTLQQYCLRLSSWRDSVNIYAPKTNENDELEQPRILKTIDPQKCIKEFFKSFITNQALWYQQLINATKDEQSEMNITNPLYLFCNTLTERVSESTDAIKAKRHELIMGLINIVHRLADKYPQSLFSQTVATYKNKLVVENAALKPMPLQHFQPK